MENEDNRIEVFKWLVQIAVTISFIYFAMKGMEDLAGSYKIEETIRNTRDLRIALEKYYQKTGGYPDLTKPGAAMDLTILDYKNEKGELISFANIYGRKTIARTYGANGLVATNEVLNVENFDKANKTGGWNYNFTGQTGEIHPNLPDSIYGDKVNWNKQ